ncbi:MAG: carboxypeptidase-like regulatory domain-containing protein [Caldilineaceae bacterium]
MSDTKPIHHTVAIAGVVQDKVSQVRLAHALIEIISGPSTFQTRVQAQAADPAWLRQPARIDRTWSQADGIFFFLDLPEGSYRLRVTMVDLPPQDYRLRGSLVTSPPHDYRLHTPLSQLGTRYGLFATDEKHPLQVVAPQDGKPAPIARADVQLPPTRIHGVVTALESGEPVVGAKVRLRGDPTVISTQDDGRYELVRLVAGKPTVAVAAAGYKVATRSVSLNPGQDRMVNFKLQAI